MLLHHNDRASLISIWKLVTKDQFGIGYKVSVQTGSLWHEILSCTIQAVENSKDNISHVVRKPVFAISEQQRRRSACASAQSDQRLYFSLPG